MILNFASKLHSFGVDKLQLGHGDVFNGVATNDLTGDAIKASLLEGKSVAKMSAVGKTAPTVSDTNAALATANASNIDSFIEAYRSGKSDYAAARTTTLQAKATYQSLLARSQAEPGDTELQQQTASAKTAFENAVSVFTAAKDKVDAARNKMVDAAQSAGGDAIAKATDAIQSYQT
jgi:hypothetical protein